ncbi:MAG: hypothetical protein WBG66_19550, partial [Geitlerinemataceae cyanobacterium]
MTHNLIATPCSELEVTAYEEEAIHIPGYIQNRGVLLVLSRPSLQILQVSANSKTYLGIAPEQLLERTIEVI